MLDFNTAKDQDFWDQKPFFDSGPSLDEIKQLLRDDIESLVDWLFVGEKQTGKARGEIRFGARGSLQIHLRGPKRGSFADHESGDGGSPLDLIAYAQRCSFTDAIDIARGYLGIDKGVSVKRRSEAELYELQAAREREAQSERLARRRTAQHHYQDACEKERTEPFYFGPLAKACLVYFESRGLADVASAGGYIPSEDERGPFVMFPARDCSGTVTGYQRVYVKRNGERNRKQVKRSAGIIDGAAFDVQAHGEEIRPGYIAVCEGPEDALTLARAGIHAFAALGVSNIARVPLPDGVKVLAFLDDDKPGAESIETSDKAVQELRARGFEVEVVRSYGGCKDVNELLQRDGIKAVRALVRGDASQAETQSEPRINDFLQVTIESDVTPTADIFDTEGVEFEPELFALAKQTQNPNEIPHNAHGLTREANAKADAITQRTARGAFQLYEHSGIKPDKRVKVIKVTPGGGKTHAYINQCADLLETVAREDREALDAIAPEDRPTLYSEPTTLHVDVYVPTHDLQFEVSQRLLAAISGKENAASYDVVVMQGREGLCLRDKKVSDGFQETATSMAANACERTEKTMERSNDPTDFNEYEATKTLRCPHYDQCDYMGNIDRVRYSTKRVVFRIWPHAYLTHSLSFNIPPARVVVIDEDASDQFVKKSVHDVDLSGSHLQTKRFDRNGRPFGNLTDGQRADHLALLDKARGAIGEVKLDLTEDLIAIQRRHTGLTDACQNEAKTRVGKNGIMKAVRKVLSREEVEMMVNIERMNLRRVFAQPTDSDAAIIKAMPKGNKESLEMIEFWDTLLTEWDSGHDDARQIAWETETENDEIKATGKFHLTRIDKSQNPEAGNVTRRLANCRGNLLLADATPNLEVMGQALGELKVVEAKFRQNAVVYLDGTKSYSKSKLKGPKSNSEEPREPSEALKDVAKKIRRIIAAHGTNGVAVVPKAIRRDLERLLPELAGESKADSKFLHFSADRGVDRFKDADWIVIVGGQRPNADEIVRKAQALHVDDPKPIDRSIRKVAGTVQQRTPLDGDLSLSQSVPVSGVPYPVFVDERVQRLANGVFEDGLTQAIGRVRAARSVVPKRVFVFAANLPAGTIADRVELDSKARMKVDRLAAVFEKTSGVFIASPGWLHAVAPEEFESIDAARRWLLRGSESKTGGPQYIYPIRVRPFSDYSQNSAVFSGSAKVRGAKGYGKTAIVHVFAVNKEEALEKLSTACAAVDWTVSEVQI